MLYSLFPGLPYHLLIGPLPWFIRYGDPLQRHELDYLYQKLGLLYLNETFFDDAFQLLHRGKIDPRVVIRLFPDIARQAPDKNDEDEIILFDGVWNVVNNLGSIDNIGKFWRAILFERCCGLWNICNQIEVYSLIIYFSKLSDT